MAYKISAAVVGGHVVVKIWKDGRGNNQRKYRIGPIVKSPGPYDFWIVYDGTFHLR